MKQNITYHWGQDHLRIDLGSRLEPRVKTLFWIELLVTCGAATLFLLEALPLLDSWLHALTAIGSAVLYFLAAYRFLQRMFFRECIVLSTTHFTIIQKNFFNRQIRSYDRRFMGPLRYLEKDEKTDHPLKGRHFDYFGFETHEKLIQTLHQEGRMYFTYGEDSVRFARGLYSWHAEELVNMMQLYCGKSLQLGPEWARMTQDV